MPLWKSSVRGVSQTWAQGLRLQVSSRTFCISEISRNQHSIEQYIKQSVLERFLFKKVYSISFFFDSCSICVKKGMKPFLIPKENFKLLQVRNKLVSFPLIRDLLFLENQAQSPSRPRIINRKYTFLLISRIIHNFIVSVKYTLK